MIDFLIGNKYTFMTKAGYILGGGFKNLKYAGTVTYEIATRLGLNCDLVHRQIYHNLGIGVIDEPKQHLYHVFLDNDTKIRIFADPWIEEGSVTLTETNTYSIFIPSILNDDIDIITNLLSKMGYTEYELTKTLSTDGYNNSIYEIITGEVPVGGGDLDNPEEVIIEDVDGTTDTIRKPTIVINTKICPYVNIVSNEYLDLTDNNTTHASTDWQISDTGDFEEPLVLNLVEDSDNLTMLPTLSGLVEGKEYYIRVRYHSNNNTMTRWSNIVKFIYSDWYTAPSGRDYMRHTSNTGTLMRWKDINEVTHITFIYDAEYRAKVSFLKENTDTSEITKCDFSAYSSNYGISDSQLCSSEEYIEDSKSSEENTISLSLIDNTYNAVTYARTKEVYIDGVVYKCSIPNVQTAIRILADSVIIDKLDPTAGISGNNLIVGTEKIWTSTLYKTTKTIDTFDITTYKTDVWTVGKNMSISNVDSTLTYTVIPVVDILQQ